MTRLEAVDELRQIIEDYDIPIGASYTNEAFEQAFEALYKVYVNEECKNSKRMYAGRCKRCRKAICVKGEVYRDSDFGFNEYEAKCPYCGITYNWNDCNWR